MSEPRWLSHRIEGENRTIWTSNPAYVIPWRKTTYYCPFCGGHAVKERDDEDMLDHPTLRCFDCSREFHCWAVEQAGDEGEDE